MSSPERLFRKTALDRLSSPEQIDRLARVTSPRAWIALAGLGILLFAALLWGIFGSIPVTLSGQGVLLRGDGVQLIRAPRMAQVRAIAVQVGDLVAAGQPVITLYDTATNQSLPLSAIQPGRVIEIRINVGDFVTPTAPLISLETVEGPLSLVLYLPPDQAQRVQPGLQVQISPTGIQRESYGYLLGTVRSVGGFPVTEQGLLRTVGNEQIVQSLMAIGLPVEVQVDLQEQGKSLKWSTPKTPPEGSLRAGMLCQAIVVLGENRPISLILGN